MFSYKLKSMMFKLHWNESNKEMCKKCRKKRVTERKVKGEVLTF